MERKDYKDLICLLEKYYSALDGDEDILKGMLNNILAELHFDLDNCPE